MQSLFSNALSRAVAKHIDLSVTRRETFRQPASRARPLSSTMDHRNHVRQSQDKGFCAGSNPPHRPRQTLHLARLHPIAIKKHGRRAWSLFALGLYMLRKIFAAANPDQIIAFLAQLLSPKLPVKPLRSLGLR
jgi:hypothetical protein